MTGTGGVMADVTRWEMRYPISVHGENPWGPLPSPDGGWVTAADHLAALERVRVEALREARAAVDRVPSIDFGELPGGAPTVTDRRPQRVKADSIAAIDNLINAATTGDTDD